MDTALEDIFDAKSRWAICMHENPLLYAARNGNIINRRGESTDTYHHGATLWPDFDISNQCELVRSHILDRQCIRADGDVVDVTTDLALRVGGHDCA